jgi:Ca2+-binding RTX toxin-like protein
MGDQHMATMTTGRTKPISGNSGFNIDRYSVREMFTYDFVSYSTTRIRAYDDARNDTVATGFGFRWDMDENPLGGTVQTLTFREAGSVEFQITGLSLSLKAFYDYARTNQSTAAWALAFNGNDTITGTAHNDLLRGFNGNDALIGSFGADRLFGQAGNDRLTGGPGADALSGGAGADRFFYARAADGNDSVQIFGSADVFVFEGSAFSLGVYQGTLRAANFRSRAADNRAIDSNDYFIFNRSDDTLWFDRDGIGANAPVKIADLSNDFNLTAADILVV